MFYSSINRSFIFLKTLVFKIKLHGNIGQGYIEFQGSEQIERHGRGTQIGHHGIVSTVHGVQFVLNPEILYNPAQYFHVV